ncbi:hypothetical protein CG002_01505 [Mesoplasma florum]|uniref:MupG family TIM beta-alpha barrel fold protein n=1 Tax=Mesoplasma florum TaxID=2151 RepID=UPI000BE2F505|nr:MupG family TIM beta-alpha barrel fold protein [Mesoplasma florum]ATI73256.1 hypothetical protein CQZ69_01605 [Mesoplasma florum]AVN61658.1 hypothetical protein CG004_01605 [Mesoplasma florum]AVN65037.1 hypothetical protein CG002_01505 [Mesoplasma florum]
MFKKNLGISVYPEKFTIAETKEYIKEASELGFNKIFLSLLQFPNEKEYKKIEDMYLEIIKFSKELGYYVIVDIADVVLQATNSTAEDLSYFKKINVDCVRLDSPLMAKNVADATYNNLDIQLNMSANDSFIDNILDYRPVIENIYGCHNFYPQYNTGLGWEFFKESSSRYKDKGIHTTAFVGSKKGKFGPQAFEVKELVSVERHRNKPIKTQAKELWASGLISDVIVGNQRASKEELKDLSEINKQIIEFDIDTFDMSELEKEILFDKKHFARGDFNENYLRSTMPRVIFKPREDIEPKNKQSFFNKGDIVIINKNDKNYQKELIVILKDDFYDLGDKGNLVARIKKYELDLLDLVKPWDKFLFKK